MGFWGFGVLGRGLTIFISHFYKKLQTAYSGRGDLRNGREHRHEDHQPGAQPVQGVHHPYCGPQGQHNHQIRQVRRIIM